MVGVVVIGCAIVLVLVRHTYFPAIERQESMHKLAASALKKIKPGERVIGFYYFHHTLTFYTNARSFYDERGNVIVAESLDQLIKVVGREGSVLCVTKANVYADLKNDRRLRIDFLDQQGTVVLLRITHHASRITEVRGRPLSRRHQPSVGP
jgi:hypothetical protein